MQDSEHFKLIKRDTFKVPSGYFKKTEEALMTLLNEEMPAERKSLSKSGRNKVIRSLFLVGMSAAATILLIILVTQPFKQSTQISFDSLEESEMLAYLDFYTDDLELVRLVTEDENIEVGSILDIKGEMPVELEEELLEDLPFEEIYQ